MLYSSLADETLGIYQWRGDLSATRIVENGIGLHFVAKKTSLLFSNL